MTEDSRNPYLILGLDYGASKDEARRAFVRVSRRVRRDPDTPYSIEDLTWALHQVEKVNDQPEAAVSIFRVPANPRLFDFAHDDGLFVPPPEPLPRRAAAPAPEEIEKLAVSAVREFVTKLLELQGPLLELGAPYEMSREGS